MRAPGRGDRVALPALLGIGVPGPNPLQLRISDCGLLKFEIELGCQEAGIFPALAFMTFDYVVKE